MRKRAFTLVEMVTVLAIITLMAGLVYPRYAALERGQDSRDFESALLRLGSEARLSAIESGLTVQVRYDDERRSLVYESLDADSGDATELKAVSVPATAELTNFLVDGAFSNESDWLVQFFPDGTGQSCGLQVEDGGRTYNVTIKGLDGTATRAEGELEESGQTEWQAGELEQRV